MIKESCKKILSGKLNRMAIFENCKIISNNRYYTNLDPQDPIFYVFIAIESELDSYPTNLPTYASDDAYLRSCKEEIEAYISSINKSILSSCSALLKKLEEIDIYKLDD